MARNPVQFQAGFSEADFEVLYSSEEECRVAIIAWLWPNGLVSTRNASRRHSHTATQRTL